MILLALLLAAADLAWVPDSELALRAQTARTQAAALETKAEESEALRADVEAKRAREAEEKAALESSLPTLSGTKKKLAESRIAELASILVTREKRVADLSREVGQHRANAKAQADHAAALDAEAALRERESAAQLAAEEEERLAELPSARLAGAKAYHEKQKTRYSAQVAALDGMMQKTRDSAVIASLVARKNEVRMLSADNDIAIERLAEELRERAAVKDDEAERLRQLENAAKARAADESSGVETEAERAAHSKSIDAVLDGIIAREDAAKAKKVESRKRIRTTMRWSVLALFLASGVAAVVYALRNGKLRA